MRKRKNKSPKTQVDEAPAREESVEPVEVQAGNSVGDDAAMETMSVEEIELSEEGLKLVTELTQQRDEAVAARQRAQADYVNFQRRARENESRARRDGMSSMARALLPVLDHFDLALNQDTEKATVEQLLDGVRIVRGEFTKALQSQKIEAIAPAIGVEFDPNRHQAVMRQPTEEQEANTIVAMLQVGYAIDDVVLRPATVVVAAPPEVGEAEEEQTEAEVTEPAQGEKERED